MAAEHEASSLSVVLVGFSRGDIKRLTEVLSAAGLEVERAADSRAALGLLPQRQVAGLVVAFPLPDAPLQSFLDTIRRKGSAWQAVAAVAVAASGTRLEAETYLGRGVNRVITREEVEDRLLEALIPLLDVAPRAAIKIPSRVAIPGGRFRGKVLCQTGNVSSTGMLLRLPPQWAEASELSFELLFPGDLEPVRGRGRVVRQAGSPRDPFKGVGVIFSSFESRDGARFALHLSRHLAT